MYKIGDDVLLKNMRKLDRKGGGLTKTWDGPYTIAEVMDKGVYKLSRRGTVLKKSFHSTRLRKYKRTGAISPPSLKTYSIYFLLQYQEQGQVPNSCHFSFFP